MTANYPNQSVAPWATLADVCEPCTTALSHGLDPDDLTRQLQVASNLLFRLSGRQWAGVNTDVVRPLSQLHTADHGRPVVAYRMVGGNTFGTMDLGMFRAWGQGMVNMTELPGGAVVSEVTLGVYPVIDVPLVRLNGISLTPEVDYTVHDDRRLVRLPDPVTGNPRTWPTTPQRMDLPATQPNTWEVTVTYGMPPPPEGVDACVELGCQFALWRNPATRSTCSLPQRITHIARQGISATVLDPQTFLSEGKLGLYLCDVFLAATNPHRLGRRATIRNVDIGRRVRRTGAPG